MAPHAEFRQVPPDLSFLHGDVDLGFENLKLPIQQQNALESLSKVLAWLSQARATDYEGFPTAALL
jgi:hypothetical protein